MNILRLKIITPKKTVLETDINLITVPAADGEITILPHHINLFSLLKEGIVHYVSEKKEEYLAVGGGYVETDGENVHLLVSRAYGQDQIDKKQTEEAIIKAKNDMKSAKDKNTFQEISSLLRKSVIDQKLLKKRAPKSFSEHV
ncbi:ATP synthase F1 subunit epsilon [Candidatus Roizmanbacteria bacterium CG_4_10_14_0_8_um_filter_33_9]|uniref:ATP synthase epsilon chain n=1 Tax=Candidatus Roizmanbacteria bacterium CG_4_10_14_0_8_um_filter_33_9 TaxID=1974826 RepID=A0A2M7QJS7_9BACT|nr:MAG: ATP synthase F1 subunit epsilon [Candidatus Roizmanbacteria bacterium CG_4_10_14_0_8_um_filter_33_9]